MNGAAGAPGTGDLRLTRLSPSLWWYRETCNVYLWTAGDHGLLVDLGSGGILDPPPAIGVREIAAVILRTPRGEIAETLLEVLPE